LLKEEKERFDAMRRIQERNELWKQWWRLGISLSVFAVFWLVGAVVFYEAEMGTMNLTYWESVYFCWVAILSIGYGDFAPKSGSGRCAFVIWSLVAVPTVTILASDLTGTVVFSFNRWSHALADVTVLPKYGVWRGLMEKHPRLFLNLPHWLRHHAETRAAKERVRAGFPVGGVNEKDVEKEMTPSTSESTTATPPNERDRKREREHKNDALAAGIISPNLADIAEQHDEDVANKEKIPDAAALARQLALAIRRAAHDLGGSEKDKKKYSYEEWVEFTRLIRFSASGGVQQALKEEEDEGLVEWDWIGEDSPMMARICEPEFVLDRLVESLVRYLRRNPPVDRFTASLKERGEDALTMRTGLGQHGQDREEGRRIVPLKRMMSAPGLTGLMKDESGSMGASSKRDGLSSTSRNRTGSADGDKITPAAPALHPVEEENY
jgi:potassium channel subfamily K